MKRIDIAFHGVEAMQKVRNQIDSQVEYRLILMDCNMPKMDGYNAT
jgi:CheY-like chemotaxis protein